MKAGIVAILGLAMAGCVVAPIGPEAFLHKDAGTADASVVPDANEVDSGEVEDAGDSGSTGGDTGEMPDAGGCVTIADCPTGDVCIQGQCFNEGADVGVAPDANGCMTDSDCGGCPNVCINGQCVATQVDCGPTDAGPLPDGGSQDAGPQDAGPAPDAGHVDGGHPIDAGPIDGGHPNDAGPVDAGPIDGGHPNDAGPVDAGTNDAGPVDAGPVDGGTVDAGRPMDAGVAVCGDGVVESGEQCDLGSLNGTGVGCTGTCRFDCESNSDCNSSNACVGNGTCVSSQFDGGQTVQNCVAGSNAASCSTCTDGVCDGLGHCNAIACGDGCVDRTTGEQCDFGSTNNLPGSGCEANCMFSCTESPDSCVAASPCSGSKCESVTGPNGDTGQACKAGTAPANGEMCGGGDVCIDMMCVAPTCGDGVIDQASEQCDLGAGNGTGLGCLSNCQFECESNAQCPSPTACSTGQMCEGKIVQGQTVQLCGGETTTPACSPCRGMAGLCDATGACNPSVCGDGCIDPSIGEQCDDGNTLNLDGCGSTCQYEVVNRMTNFAISGSMAPSYCTPATNAFGTQVLSGTAVTNLNSPLVTDIDGGSMNIMTQVFGMKDPSGATNESSLQLGVLSGNLDPGKGAWPSQNPVDWWFLADVTSVTDGLPTTTMPATLSSGKLTAGPSDVGLTISLAGSPALLEMREANLTAAIDSSPAPNVPAPPPGTLAAGLKVFQDISANGTGQGLCGNITVESLAQIPVPQVLASGGQYACSNCSGSATYTYCGSGQPVGAGCNSMLDVIVGGCEVTIGGICFLGTSVVNATQPDVPANGRHATMLSLGTGNKVPTSQSNGDLDGYSSYLQFDSNRAHFTGQTCTMNTDCQTGQTCGGGTCQ